MNEGPLVLLNIGMDIEDKPVPRILISLFFERGIL
jgi:hypothetical protein